MIKVNYYPNVNDLNEIKTSRLRPRPKFWNRNKDRNFGLETSLFSIL